MKRHRVIGPVAFAVLLFLLILFGLRKVNAPPTAPDPPRPLSSEEQAIVNEVFALLESDALAGLPETRVAVREAVTTLPKGIEMTPQLYFLIGLRAYFDHDYERAEWAYRQAIALRPDWSWPYNGLGVLLGRYTADRRGEAEAAFKRAVELDPEWSRPHNGLAILYRSAGRLEEAEAAARRALELAPDNVATNNNYGNLLKSIGRYEEAEARYLRAVSLAPEHPKPYYNLACLYSLKALKTEALSNLKRALRLEPALAFEAQRDPDLDTLRDDPAFQTLVYGSGALSPMP